MTAQRPQRRRVTFGDITEVALPELENVPEPMPESIESKKSRPSTLSDVDSCEAEADITQFNELLSQAEERSTARRRRRCVTAFVVPNAGAVSSPSKSDILKRRGLGSLRLELIEG